MGMPHDYEIENPRKNINHVCQNVPVNTAADWAEEVIKFCKGEAEMTDYIFLRQDYTTQAITESLPPQKKAGKKVRGKVTSLEEDFDINNNSTPLKGKVKESDLI